MSKGGGGVIWNPKSNPGIDFNSGFRKTSQGGGVMQYEILKKVPPPITSKPGSATASSMIVWNM